jgi:hypothetical protein
VHTLDTRYCIQATSQNGPLIITSHHQPPHPSTGPVLTTLGRVRQTDLTGFIPRLAIFYLSERVFHHNHSHGGFKFFNSSHSVFASGMRDYSEVSKFPSPTFTLFCSFHFRRSYRRCHSRSVGCVVDSSSGPSCSAVVRTLRSSVGALSGVWWEGSSVQLSSGLSIPSLLLLKVLPKF